MCCEQPIDSEAIRAERLLHETDILLSAGRSTRYITLWECVGALRGRLHGSRVDYWGIV